MKLITWHREHSLVQGVAGSLVITLAVLLLRGAGVFESVDLNVYDWLLRTRPGGEIADTRIVLIEMTEDDIQKQGRWPVTDAVLAAVLRGVAEARPRAIGLDLYRDIEVPPGREELNRELLKDGAVIVVMKIGGPSNARISPPSVLEGSEQAGFNDIVIDKDGIVRRGLLFLDEKDEVRYSFALRLALRYLQAEGVYPAPDPINPDFLRLGAVTFRPLETSDGGYVKADAGGYQFLLDYRGSRPKPVSYPLSELLAGHVPPEALKDKVVLIGVNAPSVPDLFHTPLTAGETGEIMTGVGLHAQIVSQLIRAGVEGQRPMASLPESAEVLWVLLWGLLGGLVGRMGRSAVSFAVIGIFGLGVVGTTTAVLFWQGWWIPLVPAAGNWALSASVVTASVLNAERKQRAMLMSLFSRHVSGEVAEAIWRQREQFLDGGRPRPQKMAVTVLFSDFKGYTSTAESLEPQMLMSWINSYLDAMAGVISEHGGVIDDYAGDGIKANFGVPIPRHTEAEIGREAAQAVTCALAMEQQLERLNMSWQEKGLQPVGMRIGICTGPVVSGSIGSTQRLKYTTVGDTVNAAARLESLDLEKVPMTSGRRCRILVDERTCACLNGRFQTEPIGEVMVKGKQQPLLTHRVLASKPNDAVEAARSEKQLSAL